MCFLVLLPSSAGPGLGSPTAGRSCRVRGVFKGRVEMRVGTHRADHVADGDSPRAVRELYRCGRRRSWRGHWAGWAQGLQEDSGAGALLRVRRACPHRAPPSSRPGAAAARAQRPPHGFAGRPQLKSFGEGWRRRGEGGGRGRPACWRAGPLPGGGDVPPTWVPVKGQGGQQAHTAPHLARRSQAVRDLGVKTLETR